MSPPVRPTPRRGLPGSGRALPGSGLTTIFVRHGESLWNRWGLVQGQSSAPGLTARGREQSRKVAVGLLGKGARLVVASDLSRAAETALIIAEHLELPLLSDPRLRERQMGVAEGNPVGAEASLTLGIIDEAVADADRAPEGGETLRQFAWRVSEVLGDLCRPPRRGVVVVVTHGGVLRMARHLAEGGEIVGMPWRDVDNGASWTWSWPSAPDRIRTGPDGAGAR